MRITVTSEDLTAQCNQVGRGADEVGAILDRLTQEISNLASSWEGAASSAFQQRWQEWQAGARQITDAMIAMGGFLGEAAMAYEENEQRLSSAAGR